MYQEETTRHDKLEDYCSLLLFKDGSQEAATKKLQNIKNDFISLEKMLKGSGAHLLSPTSWRLGSRQKEEKQSVE